MFSILLISKWILDNFPFPDRSYYSLSVSVSPSLSLALILSIHLLILTFLLSLDSFE